MAGPTGLDYASVLALLRAARLPRDRREAIFDDIQIMERAALAEIHRNKQ